MKEMGKGGMGLKIYCWVEGRRVPPYIRCKREGVKELISFFFL